MDALASAYASESDDGEEEDPPHGLPVEAKIRPHKADAAQRNLEECFLRRREFIGPRERPAEMPSARLVVPQCPSPALPVGPATPVSGRYVSKRERAAARMCSTEDAIPPPLHPPSPVVPIMNADVSWHVQKKLKQFSDGSNRSKLPKEPLVRLQAHTKAVTAVRWSPTHGSLLASAGMDCLAHVWNVWSEGDEHNVRTCSSHTAAIKDIQWSMDGSCVLTCGFDQTSRLMDVETGCEKHIFKEDQYVNVVKYHPFKDALFLSGGSKGIIRLWDIRTGMVVHEYLKGLGQVMDVDFCQNGRQFVSTSDIANRNASDKAIVVWDFESQICLSNQVYLEAYTCPCVRFHPHENAFVAQSNGNYIAIFSGHPPFRMNKYKRFEGHQVSGYRIQCNFSPNGELLVSGSSDGRFYIYHYRSTKTLKVLEAHTHVCSDVSWHPRMPSVIASCGWEGNVCVFE